jgi:hypothetical protein
MKSVSQQVADDNPPRRAPFGISQAVLFDQRLRALLTDPLG